MQLFLIATLFINSVQADICHGVQCCDGNHDQWIDNEPYCRQLERRGTCGGCFKFQVDPSPDTIYCCRKHYKDDAPTEQQKPVEEAAKPAQKPVVEAPKSEEKAAVKEANDICHGVQCCDGNHDQWIDNEPYCRDLERSGKCGGCFKFQVDPSPDTLYCCRKHYKDDAPKEQQKPVEEAAKPEQKPVVEAPKAEEKAAVKEANDICHGVQCCDGNHDQWIDNEPYCRQLERRGTCGGCFKFQVDPSPDTIYCCRKHYKDDAPTEQQKPVEEAAKPAQKPVVEAPKAEEKAAVKEANDICHGVQCCDGNHDQWIDNEPYCRDLERSGKCGGCFKFQVDPSPDTIYCCRKHYNTPVVV